MTTHLPSLIPERRAPSPSPDILFVSTTGDYYGAPRSMHLLVEGLAQRGFRVAVALAANGDLAELLRAAAIPVFISPADPYATDRTPLGWGAKLWRRLRWSLWLFRLLRREKPRLVYVNTLRGASAGLVARARGVPIVWHLRGLETGTGSAAFRALRLRCVCTLAVHVFAVSEATAQPIIALGYDQARITIAYNGIDVAAVRRAVEESPRDARALVGADRDDVLIAYAGRLDPHKGIVDFIHAARHYCDGRADARFLLIGGPTGPTNPDWSVISEAIARSPDVKYRLVITGFTEQVLALLDGCDIVTLPSHAEGFPRLVLEAMALGKPMVATAVGGIPEAIINEHEGLLVPPRQPAALAAAWVRLAQDRGWRQKLGRAALDRVRTRFTIEATTTTVAAALDALLSK